MAPSFQLPWPGHSRGSFEILRCVWRESLERCPGSPGSPDRSWRWRGREVRGFRGVPGRGLAAAAPVTSAPRRRDVRSGAGGSSRRAPRRAGGGSGGGVGRVTGAAPSSSQLLPASPPGCSPGRATPTSGNPRRRRWTPSGTC